MSSTPKDVAVERVFDPQGIIERATVPACPPDLCASPGVQHIASKVCAEPSASADTKVFIIDPQTGALCYCRCGGPAVASDTRSPKTQRNDAPLAEVATDNQLIVVIPKLYLARKNFLFKVSQHHVVPNLPTVEVAPSNGSLACGLLTADLYEIGMQNGLPHDAIIVASLITAGRVSVGSVGTINKGDTVRFRQSSPAIVEAGTPEPNCASGTALESTGLDRSELAVELLGITPPPTS